MNSDSTDVPPGGGTVEPVASSKGKDRGAKSPRPASERFELRDPFSEVTYRAETIEEIAIHAERLGATRFHAVAADGKKTALVKVDGEWQRRESAVEPERKAVARDPDALRVPSLVVDAGSKPPPVEKSNLSAERAEHVERLEAALHERYVIKRGFAALGDAALSRTVYRYRGDIGRVAFTESSSRLSTDSNNPSVARSMVDVAELRNWHSIRVSGHEDFKRAVWLEASLRGVQALGYEPQRVDLELLRREREARQVNRVEPAPESATGAASKQSGRGGGRKAVLAALDAVLVAKGVPAKQREAVMQAAAENLAQRTRNGQTHKVKVYDKSASSQRRSVSPPTREVQRTRERPTPTR
jgi:hypothetical protein